MWAYLYDHRGSLVSATKRNGVGVVQGVVSYKYDAWGNLVRRTETGLNGTAVSDERFAVDGWDTAKMTPVGNEQFDTWADVDANGNVLTRRLFGAGFDDVVAKLQGGVVSWYGTDRQGSVRTIFDNSGGIVASSDFDAWGNVTAGALTDRYGFTGLDWDAFARLWMPANGRPYDADIGRWLAGDEKGFAAGDVNLSRYVGNGPTNGVDPSGYWFLAKQGSENDWVDFMNRNGFSFTGEHVPADWSFRANYRTAIFANPLQREQIRDALVKEKGWTLQHADEYAVAMVSDDLGNGNLEADWKDNRDVPGFNDRHRGYMRNTFASSRKAFAEAASASSDPVTPLMPRMLPADATGIDHIGETAYQIALSMGRGEAQAARDRANTVNVAKQFGKVMAEVLMTATEGGAMFLEGGGYVMMFVGSATISSTWLGAVVGVPGMAYSADALQAMVRSPRNERIQPLLAQGLTYGASQAFPGLRPEDHKLLGELGHFGIGFVLIGGEIAVIVRGSKVANVSSELAGTVNRVSSKGGAGKPAEVVTRSPHFEAEVGKFRQSFEEVADAIRGEPVEWFYVLDNRNTVVLVLRGTEGEVVMPSGTTRMMRGKVTVHNHPDGSDVLGSFSIEDLIGSIQRQEKMMVVVDSNGRMMHKFTPPRLSSSQAKSQAKQMLREYREYIDSPANVRKDPFAKHDDALFHLQEKFNLDLEIYIPFIR